MVGYAKAGSAMMPRLITGIVKRAAGDGAAGLQGTDQQAPPCSSRAVGRPAVVNGEPTWKGKFSMGNESNAYFREPSPEELAAFEPLAERLLALGGRDIFIQPEPHLDRLLQAGRTFDPKGRRKVQGEPHKCHRNAALDYARHHALQLGGTCDLVTGYALSADGLWVQHSWLWDGRRVLETNSTPVLYYGVVLPPAEAFLFVVTEVNNHLPGWPAFEKATRGPEAA
jgi:hypothetical protein